MVKAATGYSPQRVERQRASASDFNLSRRLEDLESELALTREELADAQRETRRYDLTQGVSGAMTEEQVASTREEASKMLAQLEASGTTSGSAHERLAQMAETGADYQEKSLGSRLIGILDIPFRALKSSVLDFTQLDQKLFGQEIDSSDNLKDIVLQRDASLRRRNAAFNDEDARWSDDVFSTSRIMEELGWEKADTGFGKFARGVGQFAAEVVFDPISWATGGLGGVSRATAHAAGKGILKSSADSAWRVVTNGADEVLDSIGREAARRFEDLQPAIREAIEEAGEESADIIRNRMRDKVIAELETEALQPVLRRDFADLPQWFDKSEAVAKEAPFLLGGVRPTLPFGSGLKGARPLPGSQGAGRALSRTVLGTRKGTEGRGWLGRLADDGSGPAKFFEPQIDMAENFIGRFGNQDAAWRATLRGDTAGADIVENGINQSLADLRLRDLKTEVASAAGRMGKATKGLAPDVVEALDQSFVEAIQQGAFRGAKIDAARNTFGEILDDPDQVEAVLEFGRQFTAATEELAQKAKSLGMDMGHQENYLPFVYHPDFAQSLRRLAQRGVAIVPEEAPEELRPAMAWLAEAVAAAERRGTGAGASLVGESAHANTRFMGQEIEVLDLDGITLFNGSADSALTFASHTEMSQQMLEAARWVADQKGVKLPKMNQALETNPLEIMTRYSDSMSKAIVERDVLRKLRAVGSIRPDTFRTDVGRLAHSVIEKQANEKNVRAVNNLVERINKTLVKTEDALEDPFKEVKAVSLGPWGKVDLPARAIRANDPRLNKLIDQAQRKSRAYRNANLTYDAAVDRAKERLMARGVPAAEAAAIAESGGRGEMKAVARRAREVALEEARRDLEVAWDAARRLDAAAADKEKAVAQMVRQHERTIKAAVRDARKAQDKVNKAAAKKARAEAEEAFPRMRFDSAEEAEALVHVARRDLSSLLDDLAEDIDNTEVTEVIEALKETMLGGDWDEIGVALNEFLQVGRRVRQAAPEVDDRVLESLAGPVFELVEDLYDKDLITGVIYRRIKVAPLRADQGEETLWAWVEQVSNDVANQMRNLSRNARTNGMTPGIRNRLKEMSDAADKLLEMDYVIKERIDGVPPLARIDRALEGSDLVGELHALRKLTLGQQVMKDYAARQGLERILQRAGLIGSDISLQINDNTRFGFELVDRTDFSLPEAATHLIDEALETGYARQQADVSLRGARSDAAIAIEQARVSKALQEKVLKPLRNKTTPLKGLEDLDKVYRGMYPQLQKVLSPVDSIDLDLIQNHIDRVIALKRAADLDDPELLRVMDSADNLRRLYWNPETAIDSLTQTAVDISNDIVGESRQAAVEAMGLYESVQNLLRNMLALQYDADGTVRRGFLSAAEEEELAKFIERGRRAWEKLGLPDDDIPFERVQTPVGEVPGFVRVNASLGGDLRSGEVIQVDVNKWLENTMAVQLNSLRPEGMKQLSSNMRRIMSWWKAQATVARPTFHVRNFIGAFWNGMYADTRMTDYAFSFRHTTSFLNNLRVSRTVDEAIAGLPEEARSVYRAAWDAGIFDDSFASTEIISNRMHRRTRQRFNPLSQEGFVVRGGGATMMGIEGNMRMAVFRRHYSSAIEAGADPESASTLARSFVNMVHFDYADLSQDEESLRQLAPFFVWFRRNLPLQMRMVVENPRMLQRYNHLISSADGQTDELSQDDLPNGMYRQGTAFATLGMVNEDTPFWARVLLDPDLPVNVFEDMGVNPATWASMMANQLGPQFDVAQLFAADNPEYKVTAPGGISQVLNLLPFDTPGSERNPYGVPRLSARASQIWRLAFPSLNELGGFALEQDPRRRQNLGQLPLPDVEGDDSFLSDLQAGGMMLARGLGLQLEGSADVYNNAAAAQFGTLRDMRGELRRTGLITPEGEQEAELAMDRLEAQQELKALLDSRG